ncbi:MAG TPA: hypothetical protein VK700_06020 [Steroidobacteraceae bacterium]|jgi:hypothetical protein|nr:hypothetical protein [Steroidobacteraceae bacterium]
MHHFYQRLGREVQFKGRSQQRIDSVFDDLSPLPVHDLRAFP